MSEQIDYIKTKIKRRTVKSVLSALISSNGGGGGGTWGTITGTLSAQTDLQTALDAKVNNTGNENIGGVKTFTSDPIIPDEAYGAGWNGSLEPPTKNAVYDKIETIGGSPAWGSITGTLTDQTDLNTALGLKAPLASPTFTGTPAAPTAAQGTNTTQLATTAFVQTEIDIVKNLNQIGGMGLM